LLAGACCGTARAPDDASLHLRNAAAVFFPLRATRASGRVATIA
jgi:hypothetical protein